MALPMAGGWACECGFRNIPAMRWCDLCDAPRPVVPSATTLPVAAAARPMVPPPPTEEPDAPVPSWARRTRAPLQALPLQPIEPLLGAKGSPAEHADVPAESLAALPEPARSECAVEAVAAETVAVESVAAQPVAAEPVTAEKVVTEAVAADAALRSSTPASDLAEVVDDAHADARRYDAIGAFPWSAELAIANGIVFGDGAAVGGGGTGDGADGAAVDGLRPPQRRAVNAAMSGRDVLVILPTGAGKSRCFQLPALLSDGLTVVVAPLLSLIIDQVESLGRRGVRALHLSSTQSSEETSAVFSELSRVPPTARLLYVTPERLQQSVHLHNCLGRLHARGLLARFVIDEAHCVLAWGKDFRPDYLLLGELRRTYERVPCTLLSATLPPPMRSELLDCLGIRPRDVVTVEAPLDRPSPANLPMY